MAELQERHSQLKQQLDKEQMQVGYHQRVIGWLHKNGLLQAVNAMGSNAAAMWKNKYIKVRGQLDALRQETQRAR